MIHYFHGFLGKKEDFQFFEQKNSIIHDLTTLDFASLVRVLDQEDILIGYSMGGRIAMELADCVNFNIKKIILLNAHPGLTTEQEKLERVQWENLVMEKMNKGPQEFYEYWNSLSVFEADAPLETQSIDFVESHKNLFQKYRLSAQPNYLPKLVLQTEKIAWIIGNQDKKYFDLARTTLLPAGLRCHFIDGGHRILKSPDLKRILKDEGVI